MKTSFMNDIAHRRHQQRQSGKPDRDFACVRCLTRARTERERKLVNKVASAIIVLLAIVPLAQISGQSVRGTLAGTVSDTSGAVIPAAKVVATDHATGLSVTTVSTSAGEYRFPQLPIGVYDLTVTAPGFSGSTYTNITVTVNSVIVQNVQLKLGAVNQSVTVNADALALQTESSDVGGIVTTQDIIQLPLGLGGMDQLRAPEAFVTLLPGVTGPGTGTTEGSNTGGIYWMKIGGGQSHTAEIVLDGVSMNRGNQGGIFDETAPSVEALQEFKVITSLPESEFGRSGGGIESFSTKSGTNTFHGTVFDLFQNDDLNANTWFNNGHRAVNCAGTNNTPACNALYTRPSDKQNDFGGSVGGYVRLPHIYNGKNKTFFFVSWEKYLQSHGSDITSTVPTVAERSGDFSAYLLTGQPLGTNPCDGSTIYYGQIFDPSTTKTVGNTTCRTAFPGNKITTLSPAGKKMLGYWPAPTNSALTQNFAFPYTYPIVNYTWTVRGDENLTNKQQIFFSLSTRVNAHQTASPALPILIDPNGWPQNFSSHYARAGWDYAIKPTLLNHLAFGTNRVNGNNLNEGLRLGKTNYASEMGISNINSTAFPAVTVGEGIIGMGNTNNADNIAVGLNLVDSLSWQKGRHSFTLGGDIRFFQYSTLAKTVPSFTFARGETAAETSSTILADSGNGLASLELGDPNSASQTVYAHNGRFEHWYYAEYIEDDFKATPTFTLNLGLRYNLEIPWHEAENESSDFIPTANDPTYNIPGAIVFASNCQSCNTHWVPTWHKDFDPRLGLAWTPDFLHEKVVFRGGAGIVTGALQYNNNFSWTGGYSVTPNPLSADNYSPAFSMDSGFPAFAPPPNLTPGLFNGQTISANYVPAHSDQGRPPQLYQFNFGIEQQLSSETIVSLGYLGMFGSYLPSNLLGPNNIPIADFAYGNQLTALATSNTVGVSPPFAGFTTLWKNGQVQQAVRPFPQYSTINAASALQSLGHSSYNALLASLQRRFHSGLSYIVSYTWSKNLNDASYTNSAGNSLGIQSIQNPQNLKGEKAVDMQDVPQQLVGNFLYDLPFGKGRLLMNHTNFLVDDLLGGWELGGVLRYESGTPVSFGCASAIPGWANCSRFSLTGAPIKSASSRNGTLNPLNIVKGLADPNLNSLWNGAVLGAQSGANQTQPAFFDQNNATYRGSGAYIFGNSPRVSAVDRLNPYYDEDFSLMKTVPIHEAISFLLKVESFNTFNRHAWALPDETVNDPLFGVPTTTITGPRFLQITSRVYF